MAAPRPLVAGVDVQANLRAAELSQFIKERDANRLCGRLRLSLILNIGNEKRRLLCRLFHTGHEEPSFSASILRRSRLDVVVSSERNAIPNASIDITQVFGVHAA